jgi:myosin heavy subunit
MTTNQNNFSNHNYNILNENDEIISRSKDFVQLRNMVKLQFTSPITSVENAGNNSIIVDESILTDDIASMPVLDDRTIAASLKAKYETKNIYVSYSKKKKKKLKIFKFKSYVGELLIAVNPLEKLNIYDEEVCAIFCGTL